MSTYGPTGPVDPEHGGSTPPAPADTAPPSNPSNPGGDDADAPANFVNPASAVDPWQDETVRVSDPPGSPAPPASSVPPATSSLVRAPGFVGTSLGSAVRDRPRRVDQSVAGPDRSRVHPSASDRRVAGGHPVPPGPRDSRAGCTAGVRSAATRATPRR